MDHMFMLNSVVELDSFFFLTHLLMLAWTTYFTLSSNNSSSHGNIDVIDSSSSGHSDNTNFSFSISVLKGLVLTQLEKL